MLNLDSDIDLSRFFSWWGQELSFLLPKKMRASLANGRGFLVLEVLNDNVKVSFVDRDQERLLDEFEYNALAKNELNDLIENNAQYKEADIVLRVPKKQSIRQSILLPSAAEKNIQQVLNYELDKYTPFNKDQVYFDFIQIEKEKKTSHLNVVLVLVKKATLDGMYERCLALGVTPSFSDAAVRPVISGDTSSRYNLLPREKCKKADKKPLFIMLGSFLLAFALLMVMLFYPLSKLEEGLDKLKYHRRLVEKSALEIEESKKGIDYLYQATQTVIDKQSELPAIINVIDTVSKVFNDETWVSQLRYSNKILQLTGQSSNASSLIELLEKTDVFKNTKFISPVTKDNRSGMERFKISTEITKKYRDAEAE
jgi:general secretion pathway protein L